MGKKCLHDQLVGRAILTAAFQDASRFRSTGGPSSPLSGIALRDINGISRLPACGYQFAIELAEVTSHADADNKPARALPASGRRISPRVARGQGAGGR